MGWNIRIQKPWGRRYTSYTASAPFHLPSVHLSGEEEQKNWKLAGCVAAKEERAGSKYMLRTVKAAQKQHPSLPWKRCGRDSDAGILQQPLLQHHSISTVQRVDISPVSWWSPFFLPFRGGFMLPEFSILTRCTSHKAYHCDPDITHWSVSWMPITDIVQE